MNRFPNNFMWGASTSAYQFEGAAHLDGKKSSQQDIINKLNEEKYGFANAEITSDHYHHFKEDVKLMKEMGLNAYRFSISWPRVLPDGTGKVNEKGLQFYNDLIDELIRNKIEPIVTLYHYDCPYELVKKYGGWLNRQIIYDFEEYCRLVIHAFKDKVKYWTTINEQGIIVQFWTKKCLIDEKDQKNDQLRYQINHHMNLAHAIACNLVHELVPGGLVGPVTGYSPVYPASNRPEDVLAAMNAHDLRNTFYLDIWFKGQYHKAAMTYLEKQGLAPKIKEGDMELIQKSKSDFLAINYYRSDCACASQDTDQLRFMGINLTGEKGKIDGYETHPGFYKMCKNDKLETTQWDWAIDPTGLEYLLRDIYTRYQIPLIITENGIGARDILTDDFKIHDDYRIDYMREHIRHIRNAIDYGVEVLGYCPWSAFDVLSTTNGYEKRYGLIYVDRTNQDIKECKRYRKDSSYWYEKIIKSKGELLDE